MLQYLFFVLLLISLTNAAYNVTVVDPSMIHSPRLYASSSVTYNNSLYVYGGRTSFNFNASNKMYKYSLDNNTSQITLSSVNQINEGPNCSFCGAVMINPHQMLLLTNPDTTSDEVVKPYIFDFTNNSWISNITLPRYNSSLQSVFRARQGHSTILAMNNTRLYTIGGNNTKNGEILSSAWYFDIQNYSYNVVEGLPPSEDFSISGNSVPLLDGNIGVLFGTSNTQDLKYYLHASTMLVINVTSNTWKSEFQYIHGDDPGYLYGVSATMSPNNTRYAYFSSGSYSIDGLRHRTRDMSILDLKTYRWLNTNVTYEKGSSVDLRYYTVSAILYDSVFINALGTRDEGKSMEKRGVDIFQLPIELNGGDVIDALVETGVVPVNVTWKSSLLEPYSDGIPEDAKIAFYIIAITATILFLTVLIIVAKSVDTRRNPMKNQRFIQLSWGGKIADLAAVRNSGFFTTLVLISLISLAIAVLAYNVVHSPISTSEEEVEVLSITIPDIRVCYSGWKGNPTPRLSCQFNIVTPDTDIISCNQFIIELDDSIHNPTLAGRYDKPTCYLFQSSDKTLLHTYQSTIQLYHKGRTYSDSEAVFVQFFEPTKNPIRKLYNIQPFTDFSVNDMDLWLDSEAYSGEQSDVADKVFIAYPDSKIVAQFETTYTLQQTETDWSYIGIFASQTNVSSLSVTHSDTIARDRGPNRNESDVNLGSINISPSRFTVRTVTESRNNTAISALGTLGGLIGVASGIYVFLFGTAPSEPWGWVQRQNLARESQMRKLVEYFDIVDVKGIPFVSPVHQRFSDIFNKNHRNEQVLQQKPLESGDDLEEQLMDDATAMDDEDIKMKQTTFGDDTTDLRERVEQLEARNQVLELVLRAYYINDEIFNELKYARDINQ